MTRRRADLLLLAAAAVWGVSFVVVKEALAHASPLLFLAVRFTIATLVLAPLVNLRTRFSRAELKAGAVLTALLATGFATQAYGLQYTTPARSAFIVAMSSVLAPLIALILLKHRTGWMVLLAVLVAGVGIYFLTAPDAGGLNRGDMWTLITAVVFGGHIVGVSEFSKRFSAERLVWLQLPGTAIATFVAAMLIEPLRWDWSPGLVGALLFLGVMSTAVALVWQMRAQRQMSSARASLIFCFEPVFAALTSWLFWGEQFTWSQAIGAGFIVGGMLLAVVGEARAGPVGLATSGAEP
ncbi:MAG TPA: EamA family transporter [Gemmatimonadales bacterium]|nr:EamA family transporter [Gemmatimonadales bacterium]